MLYKVWVKGKNGHLWTYDRFREDAHARVVDYDVDGYIIHYIVYETDDPIPLTLFEEYNLNFEVLD